MLVGDIIKVVGIGSIGCQTVNRLFKAGLPNIEIIAMSNDFWDLHRSLAPVRFEINSKKLRGTRKEVARLIGKADLVILIADLSESSSGQIVPFIAEISRKAGAMNIGFVAGSFNSEAVDTANRLREYMDTLVIVPQERVIQTVNTKQIPVTKNGSTMIEILQLGVQSLIDYLPPALICTSISDIRTCFKSQDGQGLIAGLGIGYGSGEARAIQAARMACSSPLLCRPINEAKSLMILIAGNYYLKIDECSEAFEYIRSMVAPETDLLCGLGLDESLGDQPRITLVSIHGE